MARKVTVGGKFNWMFWSESWVCLIVCSLALWWRVILCFSRRKINFSWVYLWSLLYLGEFLFNTVKNFLAFWCSIYGTKAWFQLSDFNFNFNFNFSFTLHTAGAREIWIGQSGFSRREKLYCPEVKLTSRERHCNQATFPTGDGIKYIRQNGYCSRDIYTCSSRNSRSVIFRVIIHKRSNRT